jgi:hypothetical protein
VCKLCQAAVRGVDTRLARLGDCGYSYKFLDLAFRITIEHVYLRFDYGCLEEGGEYDLVWYGSVVGCGVG